MQRYLIPILAVLLAGSGAAIAWLLAQPEDPRLGIVRAELETARGEIARLKSEMARRAQAPASPPAAAITAPAPPNAGATAAVPSLPAAPGGEARGKGGAVNFREMLANPGMKAMMEQQQAAQVEMAYAKLFEQFNLNDEERANLKQLLVEREKAQTELGLKMMDGTLTPEQRKQLAAQFKTQKQAFDASIKKFLNDETDWKAFEYWEDTKPERVQFDMMGRSAFNSAGQPLSLEQEQQLIDVMTRVRKEPNSLPQLNDPANFDPSHLSDEMIQRQLQQLDLNARRISDEARKFLTPAQADALDKMHKQVRDMSEMGMRMTSSMFGTK